MPSIPNNLSTSEKQARQNHLQTKQNWFKYSSSHPVPWLDPLSIPIITSQMQLVEGLEEYWVSDAWQTEFDERLQKAEGTVAQPPYMQIADSFETYSDFTESYTAPVNIATPPNIDDDASFAGQRLSGANPLMIKKVLHLGDLPNSLAIKDGDGPDGIKLAQAVVDQRLYICDYSELGFLAGPGEFMYPIINGGPFLVDLPCQKYVNAPIGLFYWDGPLNSVEGRLLPYAIQLEQQAAAAVFTPKESGEYTHPLNWRVAKAAFQAADALAHEWDSHLMRTHVVLAPFAISGERHLHPDHPLLVLMRPHLRYTLKINSETGKLTDLGSYGDVLLAPEHAGLSDLLKHYYKSYMNRGFHQMASLENELKSRNMGKNDAPIHYPYRDDGLPVFGAIKDFVTEYITLYYRDDQEVQADEELSAFVKELTSNSFGGVQGLTQNGNKVQSIDDLIDVFTNLIWTAGPAHAAVNYAQWDYMADPRNMPVSVYLEAPEDGGGPPLVNHHEILPQYSLAKLQAGLMYVLGTYRLDMLGHYRPKDFTDPDVIKKIIPDFQCKLAQIGGNTFAVDQTRAVKYPYLLPWLITNSTSI